MSNFVGTSGWQYRHWKEAFYKGMPQPAWLEHYAATFSTVEVDSTFYRLPEKTSFERWAAATPESFVFAVKMSRYLTHVKRLAGAAEPVARFLGRADGLGAKLGPVLLQLPPNLNSNLDVLADVLAQFPPTVRVAVEFRHPSWFVAETYFLLEKFGVALCVADRLGEISPLVQTTNWGYVRMHAGKALPPSCYGDVALRSWADRIRETWGSDDDVYVYFNNDANACAVKNAKTFASFVR